MPIGPGGSWEHALHLLKVKATCRTRLGADHLYSTAKPLKASDRKRSGELLRPLCFAPHQTP
jgi:hypothetical protein